MSDLLVDLLVSGSLLALASLASLLLLAFLTTGTSTAEGRVEGKVNVLLRVEADEEGGHVHDLVADANVALTDEQTSVVDRASEALRERRVLEKGGEKEGKQKERRREERKRGERRRDEKRKMEEARE